MQTLFNHDKSWFFRGLMTLVTVLVVLTGVANFEGRERELQQAQQRMELYRRLNALQAKLEGTIQSKLFLEKGLVAFVLTRLDMDPNTPITQEEVERFGQAYAPRLEGSRNIGLVQNGIITHIYPLSGNETAWGADLNKIPRQREMLGQVQNSHRGMLFGPVRLVQGGTGLISYTPIYWTPAGSQEEVFWGQASQVLWAEALFDDAGLYEYALNLRLAICNGEGDVIFGDEAVLAMNPAVVHVRLPNGYWQLAAVPWEGWLVWSGNWQVWGVGSFLALICGALVWSLLRARSVQRTLKISEAQFRLLCEKAPVLIDSFDSSGRILVWNEELTKNLGYSFAEMREVDEPLKILYPDAHEAIQAARNKATGTFRECSPIAKDGTRRVQLWADMRLPNGDLLSVGHDVTEQRRAEVALQESEEQFRQMFTKQQAVMYLVDPSTRKILAANESAIWFYGYSQEEFKKMRIYDLCADGQSVIENEAKGGRRPWGGYGELKHRLRSGEIRDVEVRSTLIHLSTRQFYFDIVYDVTERRQAENQLRYISFHDALTGLYNRAYFENELRRLDQDECSMVGLIICDLDGLKLLNDTLGHEQGDRLLISVAGILRKCLQSHELVARIGGDEFAIVLQKTNEAAVETVCGQIRGAVDAYNRQSGNLPIGLSLGYATGGHPEFPMKELFKEADNNMYREKLHRGQSTRSAIVQTVITLLAARDYITEGHGRRLQTMVAQLGQEVGLGEARLADLKLLAQFHDIGKVGIPDQILLKPGALTPEEMKEMQRHCEIGQRIALSSPDLAAIADGILKHQEWWDGRGYPLGISGINIPLECRILAIADAYDAMTNDRPYRSALTQEEALQRLRQGAGSQFDPELVERFCQLLPQMES